jgi:hypothetical protein
LLLLRLLLLRLLLLRLLLLRLLLLRLLLLRLLLTVRHYPNMIVLHQSDQWNNRAFMS